MIDLFPKQTRAFDILTDPQYAHVSELLYGGGSGGGKAQSLDSTVYTPFGKKRMGDIKVGDTICHPSGIFVVHLIVFAYFTVYYLFTPK